MNNRTIDYTRNKGTVALTETNKALKKRSVEHQGADYDQYITERINRMKTSKDSSKQGVVIKFMCIAFVLAILFTISFYLMSQNYSSSMTLVTFYLYLSGLAESVQMNQFVFLETINNRTFIGTSPANSSMFENIQKEVNSYGM